MWGLGLGLWLGLGLGEGGFGVRGLLAFDSASSAEAARLSASRICAISAWVAAFCSTRAF